MNTVLFKKSAVFSIIGAIFLLAGGQAAASSRIKDIADFEGVRENQLVGYGLVVGLNGTGDNIKSINFAKESLISMLDQLGINARDGQLKSKNIAANNGEHTNKKVKSKRSPEFCIGKQFYIIVKSHKSFFPGHQIPFQE